jgi:hypothetical protein
MEVSFKQMAVSVFATGRQGWLIECLGRYRLEYKEQTPGGESIKLMVATVSRNRHCLCTKSAHEVCGPFLLQWKTLNITNYIDMLNLFGVP